MALATYEELTFTYDLDIYPETGKATLTENHIIGRILNLWHFWGWFIIPFYHHYNSTGCYQYGHKVSNMTVYDFLQKYQIKMSILNFQTSVMFDRKTISHTATGQNVTDEEQDVGNSSISTYSDDGEKLSNASFGTKENYKLYNYTQNQNETTYDTYNATVRTAKINVFASNVNSLQVHLLDPHIKFMKFLPHLVAGMHSQLYDKTKDVITNMTRADYFYLIGYPIYSGYRVEHDPTLTVYLNTAEAPNFGLYMVIAGIIIAVILAVVAVKLLKPKKPEQHP
jgi:hypothetical protein